jgi:hypothetical protein
MVQQLTARIADEYPEVFELNELLDLAEITWQRWGLSADKLAEQTPYIRELIRVLID